MSYSISCPECDGAGEVTVCNPRCRHEGDLFDDREITCPLCDGNGTVAGEAS